MDGFVLSLCGLSRTSDAHVLSLCLCLSLSYAWIPVATLVIVTDVAAEVEVLFNWQEFIGLIFDQVDCPCVLSESKNATVVGILSSMENFTKMYLVVGVYSLNKPVRL